jgi:UDPglucose 6-dehydrogenase
VSFSEETIRSDVSRVLVVGAGYVGLTTAVGLAWLGHEVTCLEIDTEKVEDLSRGKAPIAEPLLEDLMTKHLSEGNLRFVSELDLSTARSEFVFVCVNTPALPEGSADLSAVKFVSKRYSEALVEDGVLVIKSTVPPGTASSLKSIVRGGIGVVSNPEFLRQGSAVADFQNPDRIVVGSEFREHADKVAGLYSQLKVAVVFGDHISAEITKYASNAILASRISFVNELSQICDRSGASIGKVIEGMAFDPRIGGAFLKPGPGWGGACFPKDVSALQATARELGLDLPLIESVNRSNASTQANLVRKISSLQPKKPSTIGVWGLTSKAGTDELRYSPAMKIAQLLLIEGHSILAYDPTLSGRRLSPQEGITLLEDSKSVIDQADSLVVLTEWSEFADFIPEPGAYTGKPVLDTRGVLKASTWGLSGANFSSFGNADQNNSALV